jgi:adenosylhomocysteine nucleosidase
LTVRLGIVVGLAAEARLARRLGGTVAIGGGGAEGARAAAERLLADGAEALVSFGLAGGLDPALLAGAILVPEAVLAAGRVWPVDPALARRLGPLDARKILGGGAVVSTAAEKRHLHEATGAAAVDLESGAVAEAASRAGRPFAVLRAICDPADRDLPPAALAALGAGGALAVSRLLGSLLSRPGQIAALLALAHDAAAARRAMAAHLRRLAA